MARRDSDHWTQALGLLGAMALLLAGGRTATAQGRVEVGATAGYTLSDGVSFPPGSLPDRLFDRVEPRDGFAWTVDLAYAVTENMSVGALWGRQDSALVLKGGPLAREFEGLKVDNFHAVFTWHFADDRSPVRPYFSAGLGATVYNSFPVDDVTVDGQSRFSTTWAAGVKLYPGGGGLGLRLGVRWTPTHIRTDPGGVWCDPYWGCYTLGNAQYSSQVEFGGGLSLRF